MDNIKETLNADVESVTVDIPICVKMSLQEGYPFEFTTSIDELGRIVLTPLQKDSEFTTVSLITDKDEDTADLVVPEDCKRITISANMLCEDNNTDVTAVVDEIGQVILSPVSTHNVFVTASFEDSLNLVTEDIETVEYCGYKLLNAGDGWDVFSPDGDKIEEGVATLNEAKILICTTELKRLQSLDESVETEQEVSDSIKTGETDTDKEKTPDPDVTAEVVEESIQSVEKKKQRLITRFMQGDIALFSEYNSTPLDSYLPLPELDSNGYKYYYDEETDAIVSYPSVE